MVFKGGVEKKMIWRKNINPCPLKLLLVAGRLDPEYGVLPLNWPLPLEKADLEVENRLSGNLTV